MISVSSRTIAESWGDESEGAGELYHTPQTRLNRRMADFTNYIPNESVLEALQAVTLVAIVGPSGSGKTTLLRGAVAQDSALHTVVSDVSRAARPEERDGVDYYFRSRNDMLQAVQARAYVQVAASNSGDLYATHIENYAKSGLALITVWAEAMPVFRALPFKTIRTLFIVPASSDIWQQRIGQHHFDNALKQKRLEEARRSFDFALQDQSVQFVINDDVQTAVSDFRMLAHGRAPTAQLQQKQTQARMLIADMQNKLQSAG